MNSKFIVFLLLFAFYSCNNINSKVEKDSGINKNEIDDINNNDEEDLYYDECDCEELIEKVKLFYLWYSDNYENLHSFEMIRRDEVDSTYRVDFSNTELYLEYIYESDFYADEFVDKLRDDFIKIDEILIEEKQIDGPPYGFSADLLLLTQQYLYYIEDYNSINVFMLNDAETQCEIANDLGLVFVFDKASGKIISNRIDPDIIYSKYL